VFVATLVFSILALIALVLMEERPLTGATKKDAPVAPVPPPAPAE